MTDIRALHDHIHRELLNFLNNVQYDMPSDVGQLRAIVASSFLCGAALAVEHFEPGGGKPFMATADRMKQMRRTFDLMRAQGGRILS